MKQMFEINIKNIRKIRLKLLLKNPLDIIFIIIILGSLVFSIYCIFIGNFVDSEALQLGYTALSFFIISFISFLMRIYINIYKKIEGKNKDVVRYEYEFNKDIVLVKNLSQNSSYILNKKDIKKYYVINNVLVVIQSFVFLFPNDEYIKKELNITNK